MTKFGEKLRKFRQQCYHSESRQGKLTQQRLGELLQQEIGVRYSGAAVSDWERGKSKISAEDRKVLGALIKILFKCGGLRAPEEADELLEAGNYRALNKAEAQEIFGAMLAGESAEQPRSDPRISKSFTSFLLGNFVSSSEAEVKTLLANAAKGPPPLWPRVLAALMRKVSERISISLKTVLWIWVWLLAWWLMAPSLRWPFADRDSALRAVTMYVAGTLIVPLLIGMLIDTKKNEYWKGQGLANSELLRLYTYQGAGIGFNLGYFIVLPLVLMRHYLNFESSLWLEATAVTLGLVLGKMSAHIVPHNLWLAYHRLQFADGGIFFVVALLGPLWGMFFLQYYSVLLKPSLGSIVILLAFTLFVMIAVLQSRKNRTSKLK